MFFYRPPKNPLFHLDVTIDQIGPRYITSYENFSNIILGAFDRAILQTQSIPQIEKVGEKKSKRIFCFQR